MNSSSGARRVRVSVPATSANLGPGFDAIGVALDLRGEIEIALADRPISQPDRGQRMALEAVEHVFRSLQRPVPTVNVILDSDIPVARGLGASAVVRAGAALAAAALACESPEGDWLLPIVSELEGHADNAAPALFGGLQVVVAEHGTVHHVEVPLPEQLRAAIFVPDFEMSTDASRRLLPKTLSRNDIVHNSSRAALLVAGLAEGRLDVLQVATDDRLHQPARAKLFPAMYDIFGAAIASGGVCAYLSGGGSSILAMTAGDGTGIAAAMLAAAAERGVRGKTITTGFSRRGAEIVETG